MPNVTHIHPSDNGTRLLRRGGQNSQLPGGCLYALLNDFLRLTRPQEHGIFDALGKQYLRSFIFAIYLVRSTPHWQVFFTNSDPQDSKDPNK